MIKTKERVTKLIIILGILVFVWVGVTNIIQAFKCPKMTNTELAIHFPKSFMLDWKECTNY